MITLPTPTLFAILLLATACTAQEVNCDACRTGTFIEEIEPEVFTTYERSADQQVERTPALGVVGEHKIKWTGPCTYQLYDRVILEGENPRPTRTTDTLTVRIIQVDSAGFDYVVTATFSEMELPGRQTIVPTDR
jgi:hypothetical protein